MTSVDSTRNKLLDIERAHRDDHDGGYKLAFALCEYRETLSAHDATDWDEVLLGWIRDEAPTLWGVALEALARAGGDRVNGALSQMLRESQHSLECRDYITNTLIRRGVTNQVVRTEVQRGACSMSPMGLPNLAALLVLSPEFLDEAARLIDEAISSGRQEYVDANVPPFVYAAIDGDYGLLPQLVEKIRARNWDSGASFASMLIEYLQKPFVQKRMGPGNARRVVAKLQPTH